MTDFAEMWKTKHRTEKKGVKAAYHSGTKKKEKPLTNQVRENKELH